MINFINNIQEKNQDNLEECSMDLESSVSEERLCEIVTNVNESSRESPVGIFMEFNKILIFGVFYCVSYRNHIPDNFLLITHHIIYREREMNFNSACDC